VTSSEFDTDTIPADGSWSSDPGTSPIPRHNEMPSRSAAAIALIVNTLLFSLGCSPTILQKTTVEATVYSSVHGIDIDIANYERKGRRNSSPAGTAHRRLPGGKLESVARRQVDVSETENVLFRYRISKSKYDHLGELIFVSRCQEIHPYSNKRALHRVPINQEFTADSRLLFVVFEQLDGERFDFLGANSGDTEYLDRLVHYYDSGGLAELPKGVYEIATPSGSTVASDRKMTIKLHGKLDLDTQSSVSICIAGFVNYVGMSYFTWWGPM